MEKEKRTIKKSFRFTQSEWIEIEKKCNYANITPTQYFQNIALDGKTARSNCIKVKQMYLGRIAMIGNNLNQIARKLNTDNKVELWMLHILINIEKHLNEKIPP